jgi:hypothetical protein
MMQTNKNSRTFDIEQNQYKHLRTINTNNKLITKKFSITNEAVLFGILGGAGIAMFLIMGQLMVGSPIALKCLKFIALFGVLRYGIDALDTDKQNNYNFMSSLQFGLFVTIAIAGTLAIFNVILFWVFPDLAFDSFSTQIDSIRNLVLASRIFFIETLVFGVTITLIILQGLRTNL